VGFDKDGVALPGRAPDPDAAAASLVFKLHVGPHGDLTFVRVYAGTIRPGQKLWNPRVKRMERAARILRMHGQGGEAIESAGPGEIVALTGLKFSGTGDTLCDRSDPLMIEPPTFPEPVIALVAEPASAADRDKLRQALQRLAHEDPSFRAREDEDSGQWTIQGMGELHLEVQLHRLEQEFKVEARVGQPRVSYREAVRASGHGSSTVDRVLGGKEVFGSVAVEVQPAPEDTSTSVSWAEDCGVPEPFRQAVEESLILEAQSGPRFGFPLLGCTIQVVGGQSRDRVDHEGAFVQAAAQALRQALAEARVEILEPVMHFEVETPEDFASGLISDLGGRQAEVQEVRAEHATRSIRGKVPLATMFGYSTVIRSLSQGRAGFSLSPAGFVPVAEAELEVRGLVWT
jgi:elongation factor G